MARWVLYENNRSHLTLLYKNMTNGQVFNCGELRRDIPSRKVLEWVVGQAAIQAGDLIKLQDGTVLQMFPEVARV